MLGEIGVILSAGGVGATIYFCLNSEALLGRLFVCQVRVMYNMVCSED